MTTNRRLGTPLRRLDHQADRKQRPRPQLLITPKQLQGLPFSDLVSQLSTNNSTAFNYPADDGESSFALFLDLP